MTVELKAPVAAYYAAEAAKDYEAAAGTFAPEGQVKDERQSHTGRAAIAAWMAEGKAKYQHTSEVVSAETSGDGQVVTVKVSGNFPGSPIMLDHAFRIADGQIVALEIG